MSTDQKIPARWIVKGGEERNRKRLPDASGTRNLKSSEQKSKDQSKSKGKILRFEDILTTLSFQWTVTEWPSAKAPNPERWTPNVIAYLESLTEPPNLRYPPYHAIPFWDSIVEGVLHPFPLVLYGITQVSLRCPSCIGWIATHLCMIGGMVSHPISSNWDAQKTA